MEARKVIPELDQIQLDKRDNLVNVSQPEHIRDRSIGSVEADEEIDLNYFDVEEHRSNLHAKLKAKNAVTMIQGDVSRCLFKFKDTKGFSFKV